MILLTKKSNRIQLAVVLFIFVSLLSLQLFAQESYQTEIKIPDILGYKALKCDFYMHSVFSDGQAWPTMRAEEAWREGMEAIRKFIKNLWKSKTKN